MESYQVKDLTLHAFQQILMEVPDLKTSGIAPSLIPVLSRLLSKEPQDRFGDATKVIEVPVRETSSATIRPARERFRSMAA